MESRPPSTVDHWTSPERTEILRRSAERLGRASREDAELLLDAAEIAAGQRVLDLACGAGDPTLLVAERVGPTGSVVGADLSEGALEVGRERAQRAGLSNVRFQVANAEALPFPDASFDRALSRFGSMFFEDLGRATAEIRRVLGPGGRVALMVWAPSDRQPYFQATVGVVLKRLGLTEPPPERNVAYRFARPGPLESALAHAGFSKVEQRTLTASWTPDYSPEEARDDWWSQSPYWRPLIERIPERDRASVREEIADRLRPFYDGRALRLPETVRVVTAAR